MGWVLNTSLHCVQDNNTDYGVNLLFNLSLRFAALSRTKSLGTMNTIKAKIQHFKYSHRYPVESGPWSQHLCITVHCVTHITMSSVCSLFLFIDAVCVFWHMFTQFHWHKVMCFLKMWQLGWFIWTLWSSPGCLVLLRKFTYQITECQTSCLVDKYCN